MRYNLISPSIPLNNLENTPYVILQITPFKEFRPLTLNPRSPYITLYNPVYNRNPQVWVALNQEAYQEAYQGLGFRVGTNYIVGPPTTWVVLQIMGPFGCGLYGGTYYLGVPKWDSNFGNYPHHAGLMAPHMICFELPHLQLNLKNTHGVMCHANCLQSETSFSSRPLRFQTTQSTYRS